MNDIIFKEKYTPMLDERNLTAYHRVRRYIDRETGVPIYEHERLVIRQRKPWNEQVDVDDIEVFDEFRCL